MRAIEVAGGGREAAGLRASCRFSLAWEFAAGGSEGVALKQLAMASAEWGGQGNEAWRRGDVLRLVAGHTADAEASLYSGLGSDRASLRSAASLIALARLHLADGDVDEAASDLSEAFLANRSAGARQKWVMAARKLMPDCLAVRELDAVMCSGMA
jgi:hypothetical protein